MAAVFDKEQWNWRRAYRRKLYPGNLNNTVYVTIKGWKKARKVYVEVPSEFFTLFVGSHPDMPLDEVDLFAEYEADSTNMVFGYQLGDGTVVDLWMYYKLPDWLNPEVESDPS